MKRISSRLWQCLLLLILAVVAGTLATQAQITSGSVYKLRNQCSNKVLDVSEVSLSNGALVHQWTDVDGVNQQWKIQSTDSGYYKLTAVHSGKALDVTGGKTSDGTLVQQWEYVGGRNQQWKVVDAGSGYYKLVPRHATSKALDVNAASTADGAKVQIWASNSSCAQRWKLELVGGGTPTPTPTPTPAPTPTPTPTPSLNQQIDVSVMTKTTGGADADGSWNLWSEGYVETPAISFPSTGTYKIEVDARGSYAGGAWPVMEVRVDGQANGTVSVASASQSRYAFNVSVAAGSHQIQVAFTNDYYDGQNDRNLYVRRVLVSGPTTNSPTPTPTPNPIPPDAIVLSPGQDLQAAVNANPDNAKFYLKAGVYKRQRVVPKHGNTFIGEPGAILDGENAQTFAFGYDDSIRHPLDVTIKGLIVERYTNPDRRGTIYGTNTTNWLVEDNEFRYNAGNGVEAGQGMRILRNKLHHNGCVGIGGYKADGMLIEGNEIAFNNTSKDDPDTAVGTCGGIKIVTLNNVIVRDNYVHDNYGPGIWCDIDCNYVTIENNRVFDNTHRGIFYEISYNGIIRNNVIERNGLSFPGWPGGTGIFISSSSGVEVYGNQISDNAGGVTAWDGPRGSGIYGTWQVSDLYVHDNVIKMKQGFTGMGHASNDPAMFNSRNNRFANNTYYLGANSNYFQWMGASRNESQWKSFNQDVDGKFYR